MKERKMVPFFMKHRVYAELTQLIPVPMTLK